MVFDEFNLNDRAAYGYGGVRILREGSRFLNVGESQITVDSNASERHRSGIWPILLSFPAGVVTGLVFPTFARSVSILPAAFVQLLQIVIGPLVLITICLGVYESNRAGGAVRQAVLGLLGAFLLTAIALVMGVGLAVLLHAGIGFNLDAATSRVLQPRAELAWNALVPGNPIAALARCDTTQLVGIGALFGFAMLRAGDSGERVAGMLAALLQVLFRLTALLVKTAPLAAWGATAALVSGRGITSITQFWPLVVALAAGLAGLGLVLFPLLLWARGVNVLNLWRLVQQPVLIAFASASGAAALPGAIASLEQGGVRRETVRVVYPLCAMLNATGSTLFMGSAAVFLLQASGIAVTTALGIQVVGILYVLGKVIPAVPRGALAIIATSVAPFGVSADAVAAGIGLLLAVDTLFDMTRTAINVWGSCALVAAIDDRQACRVF